MSDAPTAVQVRRASGSWGATRSGAYPEAEWSSVEVEPRTRGVKVGGPVLIFGADADVP